MSARPLAIITTRLPPAACGIGTYSWLLRTHWPDDKASVEFLVMEAKSGLQTADRVTVFGGDASRLAGELDRIGTADVLLQYAGRAYQRFGCPLWMPGVLANWKRKFPHARLTLIVHELPGRFPITSRHFWLGKLNAHVLRRLSSIAEVVVTNTANHCGQLRELSGRDDIELMPVGSNIEIAAGPSQARTRTEFILFGLPFGRLQTLRLFEGHIRQWHVAGQLTKLHIVGPTDDPFSREADEFIRAWPNADDVVRHGTLPSREVASLLRRVGFALTNVSEETWSKSGAFMACAANECPVVVASARSKSVPLSYAVGADEVGTISDAELAKRTAALAEWYRTNADWPVIANRVASLGGTTALLSRITRDGTAPVPPRA